MAMEFWGVEIKSGETKKVTPDDGRMIHVSLASLGEVKKGQAIINATVGLHVKVKDKSYVLVTLSHEKNPQWNFDLVFDDEFELSHTWKHGSVYLMGYSTLDHDESVDDMDSEEDFPLQNMKSLARADGMEPKPEANKNVSAKSGGKPDSSDTKVKFADQCQPDQSDEDDSEGDGFSEEDESDKDMSSGDDGSDEDLEGDSEDEETPKPVATKKRANDSTAKTPPVAKKTKTDDKKGVHAATPHPSKPQKTKVEADTKTASQKSQKSGGKFQCSSCDRFFGTEGGLQSHSMAKHAK